MADAATLARAQAGYYAITGVWPLIDMGSFQALTGPKREHWLVKTVGAVVAVAGASLWTAARRDPRRAEVVVLGAGTAAALGAIDIWYVAKGRISPVYLVDGATQGALLAGWVGVVRDRSATG